MKLISYASNLKELNQLKNAGVSEVLLCHSQLSRLGTLSTDLVNELAEEAWKLDLRPVLEWDILMTQESLNRSIDLLNAVKWDKLSAIRVQDPGAFEYALQKGESLPIQLVLETGNRNLESIRRWCEYGKGRVERVVLSIELPESRIAQVISELPIPVELLGLGPILLLYTPRHLLSNERDDFSWMNRIEELDQHRIEVIASSEQTLHSGFRVIENQHGTLLFHAKDYCLLDQIPELRKMNLGALRVDYRLEKSLDQIESVGHLLKDPQESQVRAWMDSHPRKLTRCFFKANATDVLFKKLKNVQIQRRDSNYLGDVVEISRGNYTIIHVLSQKLSLRVGQDLSFVTPEGQTVVFQIHSLKDLDQRSVEQVSSGDFAVIQYVKHATPGSSVYENVGAPTS